MRPDNALNADAAGVLHLLQGEGRSSLRRAGKRERLAPSGR